MNCAPKPSSRRKFVVPAYRWRGQDLQKTDPHRRAPWTNSDDTAADRRAPNETPWFSRSRHSQLRHCRPLPPPTPRWSGWTGLWQSGTVVAGQSRTERRSTRAGWTGLREEQERRQRERQSAGASVDSAVLVTSGSMASTSDFHPA